MVERLKKYCALSCLRVFLETKRHAMKKLYLLFLMVATAAFAGYSQQAAPTEILQFKEVTYDFGKIAQGRPVTHNFEVINTSKSPVMIESVEATCGCTTPEWN